MSLTDSQVGRMAKTEELTCVWKESDEWLGGAVNGAQNLGRETESVRKLKRRE